MMILNHKKDDVRKLCKSFNLFLDITYKLNEDDFKPQKGQLNLLSYYINNNSI